MFIQKRKTISVVFLFCNHLSADKGKPRRRFSLDPFQPVSYTHLVHALGMNIMTYTGYTFEKLTAGFEEHPQWKELLEQTDIDVYKRQV